MSSAENTASDSNQAATIEVGRMTGYFTIPVERLVTACKADPNKSVSDLLEEEAGQQQSGDSSAAATKN